MIGTAQRLPGLDTLRFLAALTVVLAHEFEPPLFSFASEGSFWADLGALYDHAFPGQAAVILFFVISGLCIHWPAANGAQVHAPRFWLRRGVRLCLPLGLAFAIALSLDFTFKRYTYGIAWTLFAEASYYALYPLLLLAQRRWGWAPLLALAYAAALAANLTSPADLPFQDKGLWLTALAGLPCWLLGCLLAERFSEPKAVRQTRSPWHWRLALIVLLAAIGLAKQRWGLGNPWSLQLFAIFAFFWLKVEVARWRDNPPWRIGEKLGLAAYSLYLVHHLGPRFLWSLVERPEDPWARWALAASAIVAATTIFYFMIERPSHLLARRLSR